MKTLKELGVGFKDLKGAVTALNGTKFLAEKLATVGIKGPELLVNFLVGIDSLTEDQANAMPKTLATFYGALPEAVFESNEAGEAEGTEAGTESGTDVQVVEEGDNDKVSDCPVFGKQNTDEPECKSCKKDTPDEFKACKKVTKADKAKADKAKVKTPKGPGPKTRYGHNPGSMGGDIDDMVWEGATMKKMVGHIAKNYDRDEAQAKSKIFGHLRWLKNKKGIVVTMAEKGKKYQADKEYMDGRTADNSVASKATKK